MKLKLNFVIMKMNLCKWLNYLMKESLSIIVILPKINKASNPMEEVKTFNANHPFIFMKYHKASEEILFMARFNPLIFTRIVIKHKKTTII